MCNWNCFSINNSCFWWKQQKRKKNMHFINTIQSLLHCVDFQSWRPLVRFCLASKSYQMRNIDMMYSCCSDIDTCQVRSMIHYNFSFQGQLLSKGHQTINPFVFFHLHVSHMHCTFFFENRLHLNRYLGVHTSGETIYCTNHIWSNP